MRKFLGIACLVLTAVFANAQASPDKGFYGAVSYGTAHDSSLGWTSESDYLAGRQFNSHVSVEAGIPVWLVATTESTSQSGATVQKTQTGKLGDAFLRINIDPHFAKFGYRMSITGTAPTGDTDLGLSTGRAGIQWSNYIEKDLGFISPFGELALSNTQGSTRQVKRSYSVLGTSAAFRGGANFDLKHHLGLSASVYDVAPFGTQKMYSRVVAQGTPALTMHKGRPFASQAVTVGDASIAADHGFSAGLSFDPSPRVNISVDYNRSIVQSLDSVGMSISYRFGHIAGAKPRS